MESPDGAPLHVRRILAFLLLVLMAAPPLQAVCTYFRIKAKVQSCKAVAVSTETVKNPYAGADDPPEFSEAENKATARMVCSCEYSLKGSHLLCDTDQTQEFSATLGGETVKEACLEG